MSDFLFGRQAALLVARPLEDFRADEANALLVEQLRVTFDVEKNLGSEPNSVKIEIYNAAEPTRARMQEKYLRVFLQAGYAGDMKLVCVGDVRKAYSKRDGTSWVTTIEAGDAERALLHARVNKSYKAGVRGAQIIDDAVKAMGQLDFGALAAIKPRFDAVQHLHGYSARGRASREIDRITEAAGVEWSIQDGRIQFLPKGEANRARTVELAEDSGLVGAPEWSSPRERSKKKPMLQVKSLLMPEIRPGGLLVVKSSTISATCKVHSVKHNGDTHGSDWYSEMECEPL